MSIQTLTRHISKLTFHFDAKRGFLIAMALQSVSNSTLKDLSCTHFLFFHTRYASGNLF